MQFVGPRVPYFHLFRSTISRFPEIAHFMISPLTPMLKFQSTTKSSKTWMIAEKSIYLCSSIVVNVVIDFG